MNITPFHPEEQKSDGSGILEDISSQFGQLKSTIGKIKLRETVRDSLLVTKKEKKNPLEMNVMLGQGHHTNV